MTFTNMPGYFALALMRAACVIALVGGVAGCYAGAAYGIGPGLLALALWLLLFWATFSAAGRVMRRRRLILDSSGLAVERATFLENRHRVAQARWEQVLRIGYVREPTKPDSYLGVWISVGGSKPASVIRLCPVGSRHFPISDVLAAILTYCPTVRIEPLQDQSSGS